MLRITRNDMEDGSTMLRLEGRMIERELEMLHATCAEFRENRHLVLDLSGVFFADLAGFRAIRDFQARGVNLNGCSPFISQRLKELHRGHASANRRPAEL